MDRKKIHISNLSPATIRSDLRKRFNEYGKVRDIKIVYDRKGLFRGCAFLSFDSQEMAKKALAADGTVLRDNIIRVKMAINQDNMSHVSLTSVAPVTTQSVEQNVQPVQPVYPLYPVTTHSWNSLMNRDDDEVWNEFFVSDHMATT